MVQDGSMQLRIFTEPQQGADYGRQLAVARAAEELGFDAFFRSHHYLTLAGSGSSAPPPPPRAGAAAGPGPRARGPPPPGWPARRHGSGSAPWSAPRPSATPG